jgi:putative oxidoreductase
MPSPLNRPTREGDVMNLVVGALIDWPARVASQLQWLAPLFARIVVGWVFLWTGWGKLTHLPLVTENFSLWGVPAPEILAPFVSGVEFFGGILLLLGLLTRVSAGALGVVMIVAVKVAQWDQVDSLQGFLGLEEIMYLALFVWLAIAGPGKVSVDRLIEKRRST